MQRKSDIFPYHWRLWFKMYIGLQKYIDLVGLSPSGLLYTIMCDYPFQGFCKRSRETIPFRTFVHNHVGLSLSGLLYTISWDYLFQGFCTRSCETIPFRAFVQDLVTLFLSGLLNTISWDYPFQGFCRWYCETTGYPCHGFCSTVHNLVRLSLSGYWTRYVDKWEVTHLLFPSHWLQSSRKWPRQRAYRSSWRCGFPWSSAHSWILNKNRTTKLTWQPRR